MTQPTALPARLRRAASAARAAFTDPAPADTANRELTPPAGPQPAGRHRAPVGLDDQRPAPPQGEDHREADRRFGYAALALLAWAVFSVLGALHPPLPASLLTPDDPAVVGTVTVDLRTPERVSCGKTMCDKVRHHVRLEGDQVPAGREYLGEVWTSPVEQERWAVGTVHTVFQHPDGSLHPLPADASSIGWVFAAGLGSGLLGGGAVWLLSLLVGEGLHALTRPARP